MQVGSPTRKYSFTNGVFPLFRYTHPESKPSPAGSRSQRFKKDETWSSAEAASHGQICRWRSIRSSDEFHPLLVPCNQSTVYYNSSMHHPEQIKPLITSPSQSLCPHINQQGHCHILKHGRACSYLHWELCNLCQMPALHPTDTRQRERHQSVSIWCSKRSFDCTYRCCRHARRSKRSNVKRTWLSNVAVIRPVGFVWRSSGRKTKRNASVYWQTVIMSFAFHAFEPGAHCPPTNVKSLKLGEIIKRLLLIRNQRLSSIIVLSVERNPTLSLPRSIGPRTIKPRQTSSKTTRKRFSMFFCGRKTDKIGSFFPRKIHCKHFQRGLGVCPFGSKCFYLHVDRDGKPVHLDPPRRRHARVNLYSALDDLADLFMISVFSEAQMDRFLDGWVFLLIDVFGHTDRLWMLCLGGISSSMTTRTMMTIMKVKLKMFCIQRMEQVQTIQVMKKMNLPAGNEVIARGEKQHPSVKLYIFSTSISYFNLGY